MQHYLVFIYNATILLRRPTLLATTRPVMGATISFLYRMSQKVRLIITATSFHNFWHIRYRKLAIAEYIVSPIA